MMENSMKMTTFQAGYVTSALGRWGWAGGIPGMERLLGILGEKEGGGEVSERALNKA